MDDTVGVHLRQARWAVRRWAAFPVDATPRPLVLAGPDVLTPRGFRTREAKCAFGAGEIEWRAEVPPGVRERVERPRDGPAGPVRAPLMITHAGAGEHDFATDRGPVALPAWWIQGPATAGPVWVLDPTMAPWQPPEHDDDPLPAGPTRISPLLAPVVLDSDEHSVRLGWLGSPPNVETFPSASLLETPAAVSAVAVRHDEGFRGIVVAAGIRHEIRARLSEPLGSRVFVDTHGRALPVLEGVSARC